MPDQFLHHPHHISIRVVVIIPEEISDPHLSINRNTFYQLDEPLRKDDLINNIDQAFERANCPRKIPLEELDTRLSLKDSEQSKHRILLVDDNASNLLVAQTTRMGEPSSGVSDLIEASQIARRRDDGQVSGVGRVEAV